MNTLGVRNSDRRTLPRSLSGAFAKSEGILSEPWDQNSKIKIAGPKSWIERGRSRGLLCLRDTHIRSSSSELRLVSLAPPDLPYPSSPLKSACLKYFIPTHATTTHTQAMMHVKTSSAG